MRISMYLGSAEARTINIALLEELGVSANEAGSQYQR